MDRMQKKRGDKNSENREQQTMTYRTDVMESPDRSGQWQEAILTIMTITFLRIMLERMWHQQTPFLTMSFFLFMVKTLKNREKKIIVYAMTVSIREETIIAIRINLRNVISKCAPKSSYLNYQ